MTAHGHAGLIVSGQPFISNPDPVKRMRREASAAQAANPGQTVELVVANERR